MIVSRLHKVANYLRNTKKIIYPAFTEPQLREYGYNSILPVTVIVRQADLTDEYGVPYADYAAGLKTRRYYTSKHNEYFSDQSQKDMKWAAQDYLGLSNYHAEKVFRFKPIVSPQTGRRFMENTHLAAWALRRLAERGDFHWEDLWFTQVGSDYDRLFFKESNYDTRTMSNRWLI